MSKIAGQAWGLDLIMASTIFFLGFITFYLYFLNLSPENDTISVLKKEGNNILNTLLTEGYPSNWTNETVSSIGLISDKRINETKLEEFYNLVYSDYTKTKLILGTNYEFYIYFDVNTTSPKNLTNGIGNKPINPKNLIKLTRFTIYENKPTNLYLEIWE